ncbi:hypothetical protein [Paracoccus sp. NSM]|uniref:hypothetical protein n=1 Tax=Paracoccus sp. NSM TaxID=3457784 RepID=UPI004036016C
MTTTALDRANAALSRFSDTYDRINAKHALTRPLARAFARRLSDALTPEQLEVVNLTNARPENAACCASHDFCDANEVMAAAFQEVHGRKPDPASDDDADQWNRAWEAARAGGFRPFQPAKVEITRKRFSVTQGEVLVAYAGHRIEQYGDNIAMNEAGKWRGQPDEVWQGVAEREAIKRGLAV